MRSNPNHIGWVILLIGMLVFVYVASKGHIVHDVVHPGKIG